MFDRFLLISHGHVVYHGRVDAALPYFSALGHHARKDWNPSDFLLDLVSDHRAVSDEPPHTSSEHPESQVVNPAEGYRLRPGELMGLIDHWGNNPMYHELIEEINKTEEAAVLSGSDCRRRPPRKRRWCGEVISLWKRTTRNSIRNPLTAIVTILVQAMQGLILGGILFHLSKVGPGGKPEPLFSVDFWNGPWPTAYNYGVDGAGNHPLVTVFESGVDQDYSYVLADSTNQDWHPPIHFLMEHAVTCLYDTYKLGDTYPPVPGIQQPETGSWADWTPDRIYTNVMAAYQFFDSQYKKINLDFIPNCRDTNPFNGMAFYNCFLNAGKPILDPMLQCVGLPPMPGNPRLLMSAEEGSSPVITSESGEQLPRILARAATAPENDDPAAAPPAAAATADDAVRDNRGKDAPSRKRKLLSIGGTIGMDQSIQDILGKDLMQIIEAVDEWVTRVTTCSDPMCEKFNSVKEFIGDWTMSTINTVAGMLNLAGCLFFVASVLGFASYDALLTFPQERALFNRESANGLYSASSYYVAKNLADLPFQLVPPMVMVTIFYFMVGYDLTAHQYLCYFGICLLTCFSAYGFGYMVSAVAPRMEIAMLVAPLTLVLWLVLAGFFLRDADIPAWIAWFKYLSFYRWAFFSLVVNQFPPGFYYGTLPNTVHLALAGVTETNLVVSVLVLLALGIGYRLLGYVFLANTNRRVGLEA